MFFICIILDLFRRKSSPSSIHSDMLAHLCKCISFDETIGQTIKLFLVNIGQKRGKMVWLFTLFKQLGLMIDFNKSTHSFIKLTVPIT